MRGNPWFSQETPCPVIASLPIYDPYRGGFTYPTKKTLTHFKRADIAAAAIAVAPGFAEPLATEGMLDHAGGARLDVAGERRIEGEFVAANLVVFDVQAARREFRHGGIDFEAGVLLAGAAINLDRFRVNFDDVLQELPALLLGETHEGLALGRGRLAIHDEDRFGGRALLQAKRVAGTDDGDDAQAVERNVAGLTFFDVPGHDALFPGDVEVGVGKARAGPDVAGASLDVGALGMDVGQFVRRVHLRSRNEAQSESRDSEQNPTLHGEISQSGKRR
jgi:hypothetical protein